MSIRKNIEYLRKQKKLSQEELAFKLGVSRQAVSKWESGAAFPETEKMLSLCKIFDCTLDELMNTNIEESRKDQERKYTINDIINEITEILKSTFHMFDTMNFKSFIRFVFEIGILCILILIFHIPFSYISNLGYNVLSNIPGGISQFLMSLWHSIIELIYIVIAIVSFVYIYKIRFLDKFAYASREESKSDIEKENVSVKKSKKEKRVDVRKYDFGIFSFIGKAVVIFVKALTIFPSALFIFLLFMSFAGILITIVVGFQGVRFFSIFVLLLAVIALSIALLYVIYNFLVNHKSNWKKLFILFICSIAGLGIGAGIAALELSSMKISSEAPLTVESTSSFETVEMRDDLYLGNIFYYIEFVEDSSLGNSIKLEAIYYTWFTEGVEFDVDDSTGNIYVSSNREHTIDLKVLYDILLKDLKEKRISDYSELGNIRIKVYGSKENITKLEANRYGEYIEY